MIDPKKAAVPESQLMGAPELSSLAAGAGQSASQGAGSKEGDEAKSGTGRAIADAMTMYTEVRLSS